MVDKATGGAPAAPAASPAPGGSSSSSSPPASGSAPVSTPPGGEPGASSAGTGAEPNAFSFMDQIFDDNPAPSSPPTDQKPAQAPVADPNAPPVVTPPAPQAAPAPAPAQSPVAASEPTGVQPAQEPPPAAVQSPRLDPGDPIGLARALVEHEAVAVEHLATSVFKLNAQDIEALDQNIGEAIPRLMAKTAVYMQQQFLTQLGNIVPKLIQGQQRVTQAHQKNSDKFYSAWPTIDRVKHGDLVTELGIRYRQMFPSHSLDEMIANLGPMVQMAAKIPLSAMSAQAPAAPAPAAPKAPVKGSPNGAFVPAAPGTVVSSTPVEDNPFGYMGQQ